jgi:hypothetical protein
MHKQQHKCRSDGCRADNTCKYGFPQRSFPSIAAAVNPSTKIWQYHRPRDADANTVPYHPLLLLLWSAHCNVQRITNADWSRYVLKYSMREGASGTLNLGTAAAELLGLGDLSVVKLKAFQHRCCHALSAPLRLPCTIWGNLLWYAALLFHSHQNPLLLRPRGRMLLPQRCSCEGACSYHSAPRYRSKRLQHPRRPPPLVRKALEAEKTRHHLVDPTGPLRVAGYLPF